VEIAAMSKIKNGLITDVYGHRFWYLNDKLHRIDGPALENANGSKYWCLKDNAHRIDGPAVEYASGSYEWYLNDVRYSFKEYIIAAKWSDDQIIMWKIEN
jgi:hypothetical protein